MLNTNNNSNNNNYKNNNNNDNNRLKNTKPVMHETRFVVQKSIKNNDYIFIDLLTPIN